MSGYATHVYAFTLKMPYRDARGHNEYTGRLQALGEQSPDEIERIAKMLFHGQIDKSELVSWSLVGLKKAPPSAPPKDTP